MLREVPVAIVDESRTPLSRHYIRLLDATPQVRVQGVLTDIYQARERMKQGEVVGMVFLPQDFEAKVGRGEEAVFISYNNAITFLYYAALKEASSGAMFALNEEVRPGQVVFLDAHVVQPVINTTSIQVQGIALYNGSGGYATYLIPSVLMLIMGNSYQYRDREIGSLCRILCVVCCLLVGIPSFGIRLAALGRSVAFGATDDTLSVCYRILRIVLFSILQG